VAFVVQSRPGGLTTLAPCRRRAKRFCHSSATRSSARGLIWIKPFSEICRIELRSVRHDLFGHVVTRQPLHTPLPASGCRPAAGERLAMPLEFHHVVEKIEIWSATSDGYSFVISFESVAGPGFHGKPGYVASWRLAYRGRGAIKITGSPFKTFDEAKAACDAMLELLISEN
jgi:hypothetical protein